MAPSTEYSKRSHSRVIAISSCGVFLWRFRSYDCKLFVSLLFIVDKYRVNMVMQQVCELSELN